MSGSKGLNLQELAHRWEKDLLSPTLRKNRRLLGCSSYWRISKTAALSALRRRNLPETAISGQIEKGADSGRGHDELPLF